VPIGSVVFPPKLHSFSIQQQQQVRKPGGEFEPAGEVFTRIGRRLPKVMHWVIAGARSAGWSRKRRAGSSLPHAPSLVPEEFAFPIDAEVMAQIRTIE